MWRGEAWARLGLARRGRVGSGEVGSGEDIRITRGKACRGAVRLGPARVGWVWHDEDFKAVTCGRDRHSGVRFGTGGRGGVRRGKARIISSNHTGQGAARLGKVGRGLASRGSVRHGKDILNSHTGRGSAGRAWAWFGKARRGKVGIIQQISPDAVWYG